MKNLFLPIVPLVCALLISSCAPLLQNSKVVPEPSPQIEIPDEARKPCAVALFPENPTNADIDAVAIIRGAQIMKCDVARQIAVNTHDREHALEAKHQKEREDRAKPWWRFW